MRRFLSNLLWLIFAFPFYVIVLLMCAYAFIVLTAIGMVFDKKKPYNIVDRIDSYVYEQSKKYLS